MFLECLATLAGERNTRSGLLADEVLGHGDVRRLFQRCQMGGHVPDRGRQDSLQLSELQQLAGAQIGSRLVRSAPGIHLVGRILCVGDQRHCVDQLTCARTLGFRGRT
jgi:hypothetical protein